MILNWDKKLVKEDLQKLESKEKRNSYENYCMDLYKSFLNKEDDISIEEELVDDNRKVSELLGMVEYNCAIYNAIFKRIFPKHVAKMMHVFINCMGPLHSYKTVFEDYLYVPKSKVKDDKLVENSYEVFNSVSKDFEKYLDEIYKNRLVKRYKGKEEPLCMSSCSIDTCNNKGYIYIEDLDNMFSLEGTLNHELAHSISVQTFPLLFKDRKLNYLVELYSIYMSLYTDKLLFEKEKANVYAKSFYNYLVYLQELINYFYMIDKIDNLNNITLKGVEKTLYNNLGLDVVDKNSTKSILRSLANFDVCDSMSYLLSSFGSLHLLAKEEEGKELYSKSIMGEKTTIYGVLKNMNFDFKDIFYSCDLYNKYTLEAKEMVRTKKKD